MSIWRRLSTNRVDEIMYRCRVRPKYHSFPSNNYRTRTTDSTGIKRPTSHCWRKSSQSGDYLISFCFRAPDPEQPSLPYSSLSVHSLQFLGKPRNFPHKNVSDQKVASKDIGLLSPRSPDIPDEKVRLRLVLRTGVKGIHWGSHLLLRNKGCEKQHHGLRLQHH